MSAAASTIKASTVAISTITANTIITSMGSGSCMKPATVGGIVAGIVVGFLILGISAAYLILRRPSQPAWQNAKKEPRNQSGTIDGAEQGTTLEMT